MRQIDGQEFSTIGEAASAAGVSPQTLRVWEAKNLLRLEGKEYIVKDGDVVYFRSGL